MISLCILLSVLAITVGGVLMAFSARKPTWFISWVSAYLVLIVGIVQMGFIVGWQALHEPHATVALLAFCTYNLGNFGVILGTALKHRTTSYFVIVNLGSTLLATAMVLLLAAVRSASFSWTLAGLIVLTAVIFISMPVGIALSSRHRKSQTED